MKYCKKCGKQLDGKPCDCEEKEPMKSFYEEEFDSLNYINAFIETSKNMVLKPVTTMKHFIKDQNILIAWMALLIHSILLAIFVCLATKERMAEVSFGLGFSLVDVSYMKLFIQALFSLVILYSVFAGLLYLVTNKICKSKTSYTKMITLLGAISMVTIMTNIIAIVCIYISIQMMITVFLLGTILSIFYVYKGFDFVASIEEDKKAYALVSVIAFLFVVGAYAIPVFLN